MMSLKTLTLSAFLAASAVLATPIAKRQSTWTDPYYKEPANLKATLISDCSYQITFERDGTDSAYDFTFQAIYGDVTADISPVDAGPFPLGALPISKPGPIASNQSPTNRYALPDRRTNFRVLSVHQFDSACSSTGAVPTAFTIAADVNRDDYVYSWRSAPIAITQDPIPGVPGGVTVARPSDVDYTVSWDLVDGASGYFLLVAGRVRSSEVGFVNYIDTVISGAGVGTASYRVASGGQNVTRVAVVARGAAGVVSETVNVPEIAL